MTYQKKNANYIPLFYRKQMHPFFSKGRRSSPKYNPSILLFHRFQQPSKIQYLKHKKQPTTETNPRIW